tara:strand:+ start:1191 stop:1556 length:366 start_codon:yes stop_codon:yes gene_type:complete
MTLSDAIVSDGSLVFVSTNDFAEVVTYKPFNYPGAVVRVNRIINVVVIRQAVSVFAEDGDTIVDGFEVHVANSVTLGIETDEIDTGGDRLSFPARDGDAASDHSILRVVTQDTGMMVLECR